MFFNFGQFLTLRSYQKKVLDLHKKECRIGQTKKCVFPITCFLKLGQVGRIIFLFFEIILFACSTFYKNRTGISTFSSLSRGVTLVAPSFLLDNSLILADVLSADCSARTFQKHFHF